MHLVKVRAVFLVRAQQTGCRLDDLAEQDRASREVRRGDRPDAGALDDLLHARGGLLPPGRADHDVDPGGSQGAHVVFYCSGDREIDRYVHIRPPAGQQPLSTLVGRFIQHAGHLAPVLRCERFDEPAHPAVSEQQQSHVQACRFRLRTRSTATAATMMAPMMISWT